MDWFSEWQPATNLEIERVDPTPYLGQLTAWVILIVVAMVVAALWYRQRSWRRSFWCASVGRDVEVRFRLGCAVSCSAFEDTVKAPPPGERQPGKRGRVDPQVKLPQDSFSSSVAHAITQFGIFL